jgi:hypothetical protein
VHPIAQGRAPISNQKLQVFDSRAMPWEGRFIPQLGKSLFAKRFLEDPETGVTVRLVKYPAGFTNTWHTRPYAHGMNVLEDRLVTHDGAFGPSTFVWFPEGMKMRHGAARTEDVMVLFLTGKAFEIHYTQ